MLGWRVLVCSSVAVPKSVAIAYSPGFPRMTFATIVSTFRFGRTPCASSTQFIEGKSAPLRPDFDPDPGIARAQDGTDPRDPSGRLPAVKDSSRGRRGRVGKTSCEYGCDGSVVWLRVGLPSPRRAGEHPDQRPSRI